MNKPTRTPDYSDSVNHYWFAELTYYGRSVCSLVDDGGCLYFKDTVNTTPISAPDSVQKAYKDWKNEREVIRMIMS